MPTDRERLETLRQRARLEDLRARAAAEPAVPVEPTQEPGFLERFGTNFRRGLTLIGLEANNRLRGGSGIRLPNGRTVTGQLGTSAETFIRSGTGPIGGDFAAALGSTVVGGNDFNFGANLEDARARRRELEAEQPGVALPAKGVSGVAAARALITRAPVLNPAAATTRAGTAGALAAEGAIIAGGGTAAEGGNVQDTVNSAATGAVLSPLVTAGVSGVGTLARNINERGNAALRSLFGKDEGLNDQAVRAIADRLKVSENQARDALENFTEITGRPPSVAEALNADELSRFVSLGQQREVARQIFAEAQQAVLDARPEALRRSIAGGADAPLSPQEVDIAFQEAFTAVKQQINDVVIPPTIVSEVSQVPEARRALGPTLFRRLGEVEDGTKPLTIELADDIRKALSDGTSNPNIGAGGRRVLVQLSDQVQAGIRGASDTYDEAFQQFTLGRRFVEGVGVGRQANNPTVDDLVFDQTRARSNAEAGRDFGGVTEQQAIAARQAGIEQGRTVDLADRASRSPQAALRVADELATSDSVARTTITSGADEADRLAQVGRTEARAQDSLDALAGTPSRTSDETKEILQEALSVASIGSGRASAGFGVSTVVNIVTRRLRGLGLSDNAVEAVAEGLTINDPVVIDQILNRLRARGVSDEIIRGIGQDVQAAIAANVGDN